MIRFRPATLQDSQILLSWRNDAVTRKASHNTEVVPEATHIAWLEKSLDNKDRVLLIAEEATVPVGTVRADRGSDGVYELTWTVAPEARGTGVGKRMVSLARKRFPGQVRAEIKKGNLASVKIAEYVGLSLEREENGVLYYGVRADRAKK